MSSKGPDEVLNGAEGCNNYILWDQLIVLKMSINSGWGEFSAVVLFLSTSFGQNRE